MKIWTRFSITIDVPILLWSGMALGQSANPPAHQGATPRTVEGHIVKIDRTFINKQLTPRDRALLTMITDLGHHLGVSITAEGVETSDQFDVLADIGCDRAQGYFMAHPLTVAGLLTFTQAALLVRTPPS